MKQIGIAALFICILSTPAQAHKISIYGYAEEGKVYTESYFAGGGRCKNCTVTALDTETEEIIIQGTTDEQGRFDFTHQDSVPLKLTANAGSGHIGTYILEPETASTRDPGIPEAPDAPEFISAYQSQVEAMLEKRLEPIRRELSNLREASGRPGLTEILGGIGYIIGLLGLWAYLKSRGEKP
jgi:nickel transport protein